MFIATAIKKRVQAPEERNETCKLLRSSGALELNKPGVYKHFIPTGCLPLLQEHFVDVDFEVERAIAKKKRIPADKLVSRWIKEKLRSAA